MLLNDGILKYEEHIRFRNLARNTINGYKKELKYLLEYLEEKNTDSIYIEEIMLKDLESYIKSKKEGRALVSVNRAISVMKGFFNFLESRDVIKNNPSNRIEAYRIVNKPEREVLSEKEIEILIENISNTTVKYAVITLVNTGLRISELTNLKLEDVDFKNKVIRVVNGKGGKNRVVPINPNLYRNLKKYKEEIRPKTT